MTHHHGTEHPANRADTSGGQVATRQRTLTITQASKASGVHRSKIRRALDEHEFPNAWQLDDANKTWCIPVDDLLAAGYTLTIDGDHVAPDPGAVIDLRSTGSGVTVPQEATESPERALVVLEGWRSSLHDLAGQLADAREAKGIAETKLGVVRERLDEVRAERDGLRAQLEAAPRRRRWTRRRGQSQPAAAAGGVESAS